ncbi:MAG: hypothetical protein HYW97_00145 [Candidatus Wildermuthbacteria bacterium]|nr:hypothetical protein [Candidatus Wildermuthbacteria bacterium]
MNNGTSVSYTATSSRDVGPTLYYIRIYEGSTQRKTCSTGTTCSYSTSDNNTTRTFVGKIEDLNGSVVAATSNSVSTTWIKIATQLPDANFSFNPTAVVQGKSTTVSGWLTTSTGAGIGGKTIVLQCWNGTDWPQVASGSTENTDPDTGFTSFSWTPTSSWKGDISCRLNFAGDTTYASSASGQKTITVTPTAQCAAPQNLTCTYNNQTTFLHNADTLTLSWGGITGVTNYFMEWARFDKSYGDGTDITGQTSRTVGGTSGDSTKLSANKTYKLHVRADTVSGSACSVPGAFSADIECYTGTCQKTTRTQTDSFVVPVQTSNGTKNCTITATHSGRDLMDSSSVSYQETSSQADSSTNKSTIAMDDDPSGGCQDNLVFTNSFDMPSTGTLNAVGEANSKRAGHDLSFGYRFTTSECIITGVRANTSWNVEYGADESYINGPIVEADKKAASLQQAVYADTSIVKKISDFGFTLKECTQDSHCSAIPGKTYCNVSGGTRNVSAFPQNTCIDSVPPTATINEASVASGFKGSTPWFKGGAHNIPITETDADSGIDTTSTNKCWYEIIDTVAGRDTGVIYRTCSSSTSIPLKIGPSSDSTNNCVTQNDSNGGNPACRVRIRSVDKAGNNFEFAKLFNIDYTPPTAQ